MRKPFLLIPFLAAAILGDETHPTGNRTTPPTITVVSPRGVSRGTTVELTVEGLNLAKAHAILFDQPGIKGRILRVKELPDLPDIRLGSNGTPSTIDLGPLPPRNQVTVELDVDPEANIGVVGFRLQTPLGTSPEGKFLLEPYWGESPDREPNDSPDSAVETFLPAVISGDIGKAGDVDHFKIKVKAGEELVFENGAMSIGSTLQPVVSILREDQSVLKEFGAEPIHSIKFPEAGTYFVRITDYQQSGRASHIYRLKAGKFTYATSAFPLGLRTGSTSDIDLRGVSKLAVKGEPSAIEPNLVHVRPKGAFNEVALAVGQDPEVMATGAKPAQAVTIPSTINGKLATPKAEHFFKFRATKGQKLVFEVQAQRFGSQLDSEIDVLTADGKPIEVATVRAVLETFITLRDHDSFGRNLRLTSPTGLAVGDYMMAGNEIVRILEMPRSPDDDTIFENFGGQRISYLGTSGEAHHLEQAIHKVQIHPAGAQFTRNGLPLVRPQAHNDDGGPGFGKDSKLDFTAPADGEYMVRIRDVRGAGSEEHSYRLNIRPPRGDFKLAVTPKNPNIPAGGSVPVTVMALRLDGLDAPIDVTVEDLPAGLQATKAVIQPGQASTTVLLSASADAQLETATPLKVAGRAGSVTRYANPEDRLKFIALMPKPDVVMVSETKEIVLQPGGTAEVAVSITRQNGFAGRVPVEIRNLPPRVRVLDVGLNGVLINEDETKRTFTIEALDSASPVEQEIFVAAKVETRSPLETSFAAPQSIRLKVKPR
ncbi:MAG TPA: hypothetical protein VEX68_19440 [Bryobacteraceae bacterium]|nr:hypothetical protein [Bryobacteraceae bacterium]